jgi:hypothetical protein
MHHPRHHPFGVHPHRDDPAAGANGDEVILQEDGGFMLADKLFQLAAYPGSQCPLGLADLGQLTGGAVQDVSFIIQGGRERLKDIAEGDRKRFQQPQGGMSSRGASCLASSASDPSTGMNSSRPRGSGLPRQAYLIQQGTDITETADPQADPLAQQGADLFDPLPAAAG